MNCPCLHDLETIIKFQRSPPPPSGVMRKSSLLTYKQYFSLISHLYAVKAQNTRATNNTAKSDVILITKPPLGLKYCWTKYFIMKYRVNTA